MLLPAGQALLSSIFPVDVTTDTWDGDTPDTINLPGYKPSFEGNIRQIKLAADAINRSKRPVIYAGWWSYSFK